MLKMKYTFFLFLVAYLLNIMFYRLVTIVFSVIAVGIGVSVIAETHHDILYAK